MALLDGLVAEAADRFGLGAKAGPLVSGLLASLTDGQQGGIAGFLDRFRQAGMGNLVNSWIGRGGNSTLAPEQLDQALGTDTVERISSSAGVPVATGKSALAFLIPKVVDLLTPDGIVPAALPASVLAGLGGLGAKVGGTGAGLSAAGAAFGRDARETVGAASDTGSSWARKLIPVLAVLLVAFLGYRWLSNRGATSNDRAVVGADTVGQATAATPSPEPEVTGAVNDAGAATESAMRKAADALNGLTPGYSAGDLVEALNLNIINFPSGSAAIPAESHAILEQSAKAIKGAPKGTVLEVGGHTDNTGNAASNLKLSEERAQAVRKYLIDQGVQSEALTAKGYGPAKPVADDASEDGRFRNRRIEFGVVK